MRSIAWLQPRPPKTTRLAPCTWFYRRSGWVALPYVMSKSWHRPWSPLGVKLPGLSCEPAAPDDGVAAASNSKLLMRNNRNFRPVASPETRCRRCKSDRSHSPTASTSLAGFRAQSGSYLSRMMQTTGRPWLGNSRTMASPARGEASHSQDAVVAADPECAVDCRGWTLMRAVLCLFF
jgi:hypothetical protein